MAGLIDDQTLIDACLAGETGAYGELVRRYQDRLYPTALRLAGTPEDAQDLLQEAFFRAFRKLDKFHGESSFYTWIYRIAVNLALTRRKRKRPVAQGGEPGSQALGVDAFPDPRDNDPSLPMQRAERDAIVQEALNSLSEEYRVVVVMKEYDDLRYEEIAKILEIPVGTVRSRLHRARAELRVRLLPLMADARHARERLET